MRNEYFMWCKIETSYNCCGNAPVWDKSWANRRRLPRWLLFGRPGEQTSVHTIRNIFANYGYSLDDFIYRWTTIILFLAWVYVSLTIYWTTTSRCHPNNENSFCLSHSTALWPPLVVHRVLVDWNELRNNYKPRIRHLLDPTLSAALYSAKINFCFARPLKKQL